MIKLYTNRELSEKLGINLAKWKRWSREFLTPDPLGGMQSGFARQYYFRDAFDVMLGGHLVSDLHFSVYEARKVIEDLKDWIVEKGFYKGLGEFPDDQSSDSTITNYKIFIHHNFVTDKNQTAFSYRIKGIISNKPVDHNGMDAREERYVETVIGAAGKKLDESKIGVEKILNITDLYKDFLMRLGFLKR